MSISYVRQDKFVVQLPRPMRAVMVLNAAFGAAVLGAWTYVAVYLAQPIAWATWFSVYRSGDWMDIFNYPFILLWSLPFGAILGAWLAEKSNMRGLAYVVVLTPLLIHGTIIGWYHYAPPHWR